MMRLLSLSLIALCMVLLKPCMAFSLQKLVPSTSRTRFSQPSSFVTKVTNHEATKTALNLFRKQQWSPGMVVVPGKKTPDFLAALSYIAATSIQWGLILSFLHLFQLYFLESLPDIAAVLTKFLPTKLLALLPTVSLDTIATYFVGFFSCFMALKSRVFSPLDNSRPKASTNDPVFKERRRPWWTPPPLAFPIIWSTIAILRAVSTAMVFQTTGESTTHHPPINSSTNLGPSALAVTLAISAALVT